MWILQKTFLCNPSKAIIQIQTVQFIYLIGKYFYVSCICHGKTNNESKPINSCANSEGLDVRHSKNQTIMWRSLLNFRFSHILQKSNGIRIWFPTIEQQFWCHCVRLLRYCTHQSFRRKSTSRRSKEFLIERLLQTSIIWLHLRSKYPNISFSDYMFWFNFSKT